MNVWWSSQWVDVSSQTVHSVPPETTTCRCRHRTVTWPGRRSNRPWFCQRKLGEVKNNTNKIQRRTLFFLIGPNNIVRPENQVFRIKNILWCHLSMNEIVMPSKQASWYLWTRMILYSSMTARSGKETLSRLIIPGIFQAFSFNVQFSDDHSSHFDSSACLESTSKMWPLWGQFISTHQDSSWQFLARPQKYGNCCQEDLPQKHAWEQPIYNPLPTQPYP